MAWVPGIRVSSGQTAGVSTAINQMGADLDLIGDPTTASSYVTQWLASGTQPALNNGTTVGAWLQIGNLVVFRTIITAGSTTTFGTGSYTLTLPVVPVGTQRLRFSGWFFDTSAGALYDVLVQGTSASTTVNLYNPGAPVTAVTNLAPVTMASGDSLQINGTYAV